MPSTTSFIACLALTALSAFASPVPATSSSSSSSSSSDMDAIASSSTHKPTTHLPLILPIPAQSTLSQITCLPAPPFSTLWTILSDPYECLSTCGRLSTSSLPSVKAELGDDTSAVIRKRMAPLGAGGLPIEGFVGDEYDCICTNTDRALAQKTGGRGSENVKGDEEEEEEESWCDENSWVVYTPLKGEDGEVEEALTMPGIVFQHR